MRSLHRPVKPIYCSVVGQRGGQGDAVTRDVEDHVSERIHQGRAAKRVVLGAPGSIMVGRSLN
jgi:hypothetical protein